jgi:hypothetical protein
MAMWLCQGVLDTIWHAILAKKKSTLHAHHRDELRARFAAFLSEQSTSKAARKSTHKKQSCAN